MNPNNPRLMDRQLRSYLMRFAEGKSESEQIELAKAFYAGAISLQRVEKECIQTARNDPMMINAAKMLAEAVTEEIQDAANRLLTDRIIPGENVEPLN